MTDDADFPARADLPFRCETIADLLALNEPNWIIEGLIPENAFVLIYGPSGCGKSFLALDLAFHIALKRKTWFGHDIDQRAAVLYVAAEGGGGILKRVGAFRLHHGIEDDDCPLTMIRHPVDLRDPATAEHLITCWSALANPDLLLIDTWSRCLPGGNESSTEDTTTAINTIDTFRHETGCSVVVVHHSPLADKERPRGSTALFAAADIGIAVDQNGDQRKAKLMKNRDGDTDTILAFRLSSMVVGHDKKGHEITSCVVEPTPPPVVKELHSLTPNERTFLTILQEAQPHGLTIEEWNAQAREIDLCKGQKQRLYDLRTSLKRKRRIYSSMDRWYVSTT